MTNWRLIVAFACVCALGLSSTNAAVVQDRDEKCQDLLVPALLETKENSRIRVALLSILQEKNLSEKSRGLKLGVESISAVLSDNGKKVREMMKMIDYKLDKDESYSFVYQTLTKDQLEAYVQCLKEKQRGLHLLARYTDPDRTTGQVTVLWRLIPGTIGTGEVVLEVRNVESTDSAAKKTNQPQIERWSAKDEIDSDIPLFIKDASKPVVIKVRAGKDGQIRRSIALIPTSEPKCPSVSDLPWTWVNLGDANKIKFPGRLGGSKDYPGVAALPSPFRFPFDQPKQFRRFRVLAHDRVGNVNNAIMFIDVDAKEFANFHVSNGTPKGLMLANPVWHDSFRPPESPILTGKTLEFRSVDAGNKNNTEEIIIYKLEAELRDAPAPRPAGC